MLNGRLSRENTVLRGQLFEPSDDDPSVLAVRSSVYTIPNALVAEQFTPSTQPRSSDTSEFHLYLLSVQTQNRIVNIVVLSRLAYRKGIDLLVATAPRVCAAFLKVKFIIGMRPGTSFLCSYAGG